MKKADRNYLESIRLFGEQIKQSFKEAGAVKLPQSYRGVNQIVTGGMGGSQLGVDLVRHLFSQKIKSPITQIKDYKLPAFVDNKTLVFLISYSGNTEEVLAVSSKLKTQNSKPIVITVGGKLGEVARKNKWPVYQFEPFNNPSGQPRMGSGYVVGSILSILKKLGKAKVSTADVNQLLKSVEANFKKYNGAKLIESLANKLYQKIPVIVAAEFLQGNAHTLANQINESAKQMSFYYALPELNHHLLEGLLFPPANRQNLYFLFFYSAAYYQRNQKRFQITEEVLTKQKIKYYHLELLGSKFEQSMQMMVIGSLLTYQLAKLNRVDPNRVPWVNYLKRRLGG